MSEQTRVERVLRHDRWLVGTALTVAITLCWLWLVPMAHELEKQGMMCGIPSWSGVANWTAGHDLMLFSMWSVMMAGMMLPSAAPTVLLYGCVVRRSDGIRHPIASIYAFTGGYVAAWTAFSFSAAAVQHVLTERELLTPLMAANSARFGGALLIVAGLYQLSPWKNACLQTCRSPVQFLTRHWRRGVGGGFRLGLVHGGYCVGCCWALMLLLFVGGVMNLVWIAALTLFVLVEKLAPFGRAAGHALAVVPIAAGVVLWLR